MTVTTTTNFTRGSTCKLRYKSLENVASTNLGVFLQPTRLFSPTKKKKVQTKSRQPPKHFPQNSAHGSFHFTRAFELSATVVVTSHFFSRDKLYPQDGLCSFFPASQHSTVLTSGVANGAGRRPVRGAAVRSVRTRALETSRAGPKKGARAPETSGECPRSTASEFSPARAPTGAIEV